MKKLFFVFPIAALLAASCHSSQQASNQAHVSSQVVQKTNTTTTQQTTTTQNQSSIVNGQKYIVTAKIQPTPKEVSFSIWNTGGQVLKTTPVPSDLITGTANNIKILAGQIYYMSGSYKNTSVGVINIQTGQSKILNFTQTTTNTQPELYAIVDFDVSADNSKIAWMNTAGKIMIADINGSNLKTYDSGIVGTPTGNLLKLIGNYLYFDTFHGEGIDSPQQTIPDYLQQINLSNGSIQTIINDLWPGAYAISDSGKYVVYTSSMNSAQNAVVKNTETNAAYTISNAGGFAGATFSPDESSIILSYDGPDPSPPITINLSNGQTSMATNGILGFVSNSRIVTNSGNGLMITDLDGKNVLKLNNDYFEGILTPQ